VVSRATALAKEYRMSKATWNVLGLVMTAGLLFWLSSEEEQL